MLLKYTYLCSIYGTIKSESLLLSLLLLRHNYMNNLKEVILAKSKAKTAKVRALLEEGTFNPSPQKVRDPKFQENEFFDPRDLVQVKYEMLRRVSVEKVSVAEAAGEYGVSRPTYYLTKASFDEAASPDWRPESAAHTGRINCRATPWRSSSGNSSRASPCGHASWQS